MFIWAAAADEVADQPTCLFCIPGTVEQWKASCKACLDGDSSSLEVSSPALLPCSSHRYWSSCIHSEKDLPTCKC